MKYSLGAKRNPDREIKEYACDTLPPVMVKTDISMLPVLNQGQQPACVGHAFAKALMYDYYKKTGIVPSISPRDAYAQGLMVDGDPSQEGTSAASVVKGAYQTGGVATTSTVPNDVTLSVQDYATVIVTNNVTGDRRQYPIKSTVEITNPTCSQLQSLIAEYGVIIVATDVDEESWMTQDGKGLLKPGTAGLHETMLFGYEPANSPVAGDVQFDDANSWGETWGNGGNGVFNFSDYQNNIFDAMSIEIDMTQPKQMTKQDFLSFYAGTVYETSAGACYDAVNEALIAAGMTSPLVLIGALATVRTEVGRMYLPVREEITQAQANTNYASAGNDLGNVPGSNDGYMYRGGGLIQLTGRANYAQYGKEIGVDLIDNPDLTLDLQTAAKILVQFFKDKGLDKACEASDWTTVREVVNGGTNGLGTFLSVLGQFLAVAS